jgi:hypothetical protein
MFSLFSAKAKKITCKILFLFLLWPTKSYTLWPYLNSTSNPIQTCRLCNYYGELTKKTFIYFSKVAKKTYKLQT